MTDISDMTQTGSYVSVHYALSESVYNFIEYLKQYKILKMNKVILKFSFDHFIYSGAFMGNGILVQFKCRSIGIFEI